MATYAIGDVQGSFEELQALLGAFGFDRAKIVCGSWAIS